MTKSDSAPVRARVAGSLVAALGVLLLAPAPALGLDLEYCPAPAWPQIEDGTVVGQVAGIGVGTDDTIYLFHRGTKDWGRGGRFWSRLIELVRRTFPEALTGYDPAGPVQEPAILALNPETGNLISAFGAGQFLIPHGLALDAQDNLWVTDVGLHQVFKLSRSGEILLTVGVREEAGNDKGHFDQPTDVAVAADGAFYVADGYGNSRVVKFSAAGEYLFEWGSPGDGPGQFSTPHGLALDSAGNLYVADRGNKRVQVFDSKGEYLREFSGRNIGRPWAVDIAADGKIFISDGGDQNPSSPRSGLVVLAPDGTFIGRWSRFGYGPGELVWPHDLAVSRDLDIYVGEILDSRRVQKFVPSCG